MTFDSVEKKPWFYKNVLIKIKIKNNYNGIIQSWMDDQLICQS